MMKDKKEVKFTIKSDLLDIPEHHTQNLIQTEQKKSSLLESNSEVGNHAPDLP